MANTSTALENSAMNLLSLAAVSAITNESNDSSGKRVVRSSTARTSGYSWNPSASSSTSLVDKPTSNNNANSSPTFEQPTKFFTKAKSMEQTKLDSNNISSASNNSSSINNLNSVSSVANYTKSSPTVNVAAKTRPKRRIIQALRFEKVSPTEWVIHETKIFDLDSFLNEFSSSIYLIDENKISSEEKSNRRISIGTNINITAPGNSSIDAELNRRQSIVTSWNSYDFKQLKCFLTQWAEEDCDLISSWTGVDLARDVSSSHDMPSRCSGVLCYEILNQVGVILRANPMIGITHDRWKVIYAGELLNITEQLSWSAILSLFFPEVKGKLLAISESDFEVRYHAHIGGNKLVTLRNPPAQEREELFQNMGLLSTVASSIVDRLDRNCSFHDFMLISNQDL